MGPNQVDTATQSTPPGPALSPQVIEDVATRHLTNTSRPVPAIVERVIEELHHEVSIAAPTVNRRDRQLSPSWPRYPLSPAKTEASVTDLMMRAFPGQVRRILEWSIQHPAKRSPPPEGLMRMLAVIGGAGSSELLRVSPTTRNSEASAIAAIKYLSDDRG